jgi:hypothetical protein
MTHLLLTCGWPGGRCIAPAASPPIRTMRGQRCGITTIPTLLMRVGWDADRASRRRGFGSCVSVATEDVYKQSGAVGHDAVHSEVEEALDGGLVVDRPHMHG